MTIRRSPKARMNGSHPDLDKCAPFSELVELTIRKMPQDRVRLLAAHLFVCRNCSRRMARIRAQIESLGSDALARLRANPLPIPEILRDIETAASDPEARKHRPVRGAVLAAGGSWLQKVIDLFRQGVFVPQFVGALAAGDESEAPQVRVMVEGGPRRGARDAEFVVVVPPTMDDRGRFFLTVDVKRLPAGMGRAEAAIIVQSKTPRKRKAAVSGTLCRLSTGRVHLSAAALDIAIEASIQSVLVLVRREG